LWSGAGAAPTFPELSGRVTDEAGLLSAATRAQITQLLAQHEQATSNQVVVVILKSLQGYTIEDYGYQLGRHWGLGQKQRDNGVLLIVAPKERRVRIEVGYGLEGTLTDALSSNIIQTRILPQFRQQHFDAGVLAGVQAILEVLKGSYTPITVKQQSAHNPAANLGKVIFVFIGVLMLGDFLHRRIKNLLATSSVLSGITFILAFILAGSLFFSLIFAVMMFLAYLMFNGGGRGGPGSGSGSGYMGGGYYGGGGYSGGGFGGGGFSGGGGSFGGGGASGGW
jgi:uncharacterized protein